MKTASEEEKSAQPQVRDVDRLKGDLRTLGRRISHDLRTPLNGMYTASQALRDLSPGPASAQTKLIGSVIESVEELEILVERVSFILKATADPPAKESVSMKETVWKSLLRLERRIQLQGATVSQPPSWPRVIGMPVWLEVIWWNLTSNSLQHGGAAPRIELGWRGENGMHRFWVCDDGTGVPQEKMNLLFHPFESLHELSAPRGIGLPIVRRLVELQGGRCGYEGRPGGGACFYFTIPDRS